MDPSKFGLDMSDGDIRFKWGPDASLEGDGEDDRIFGLLEGLRDRRFLFLVRGMRRSRCGRGRHVGVGWRCGLCGTLGHGSVGDGFFALTYRTKTRTGVGGGGGNVVNGRDGWLRREVDFFLLGFC